MKKTIFLCRALVAIWLLATYSCKKDVGSKLSSSQSLTTQKDSNFVSLTVATEAATQATKSQMVNAIVRKQTIQSIGGFLPDKKILDTLSVPDNENPSYYIFNYVNGGYVIVPADKRVEPILSYSEDGYFPKSGKIPGGLLGWLRVNHKNMQIVRKDPSLKCPPKIAKLWSELKIKNRPNQHVNVVDPNNPGGDPPPCEETSTYSGVYPLLGTAWAQGYPYNLLCPSSGSTPYYYGYGHKPTGCVATAIAQVMYYWKMPATAYNWTIMPVTSNWSSSTASNMEVAQLMKDIGTHLWMIYDDGGSYPAPLVGPTWSEVLKNSYGYATGSEGSYNYSTLIGNLDVQQPVILNAFTNEVTFLGWELYGTGGHTWVCDGYLNSYYNFCINGQSYGLNYQMLHMNWGWAEEDVTNTHNGYYAYDDWAVYYPTTVDHYHYDQSMTYNIHP
jgi:hypothetical protein